MSCLNPITGAVLPDGWRASTVDGVKHDAPGSCVSGPFGSSISSKFFKPEGVPVIRGSNLPLGLDKFVGDGFVFIDEELAAKFWKQNVVADDLVFTCWGTIGQVGLIPKDGPFERYVISNKQLKLRVDTGKLDPLFAYYYFASPTTVTYIQSQAKGAAVPGISLGILKGVPVVLPPLPIQKRIAAILSAYDDLIEVNTRRIAILEEMARRIYEEWFVWFRFPGGDGTMPRTWRPTTVGEALEITGGGTPSRAEPVFWDGGDIQWFSPTDLTRAKTAFMEQSGEQITAEGLRRSSAKRFPANSVMMTSRATIGAIAINASEATTNQGFITCLPNERVPLYFLYHWLKHRVPEFERLATGATFKELSKGVFKTLDLVLADETTLNDFEEFVGPMMRLVRTLDLQNTNLRAQRDLLLPRLVSGKLDVSGLDIAEKELAHA